MNPHNIPDLMTKTDLDNAVLELKRDLNVRLLDLRSATNRAFWQLTIAMILIAALAIIADRQF